MDLRNVNFNLSGHECAHHEVLLLTVELLYSDMSDKDNKADDIFDTFLAQMFYDRKDTITEGYHDWIRTICETSTEGSPEDSKAMAELAGSPFLMLNDDLYKMATEDTLTINKFVCQIYVPRYLWEAYPKDIAALMVFRILLKYVRVSIDNLNILRLYITAGSTQYRLVNDYKVSK